jgi:hypothetical protein
MQRMHRLGQRVFIGLLGLVVGVGMVAPIAASAAPLELTLRGTSTYAGQQTTLRVVLTDDGDPVPGAQVRIQRREGTGWQLVSIVTTDGTGQATTPATMSRNARNNVFRALYPAIGSAQATSGPVTVALKRRAGTLTLAGPQKVDDGKSVPIRLRWVTRNGEGVPGPVKLFRKTSRHGTWKLVRRISLDATGRAAITVTPTSDTWWQARGKRRDWVVGDRSSVHAINNIPPGTPVKLPRQAPKPRVNVPDQPRGVGAGANPVITRIPNRVWRQMTGRTWHQGCPVGRSGLRYLRINYWDYQGYDRRGELVANADAVRQMAAALAEMYRRKLPIRAMYRVDRFGWSNRVRGGNDYKSMAAGNTSAFNCRQVVGNPSARSPHSWGRSLDVNTWENPYRSARGTVPNTWWMGHSHPRVAWRSRSHAVVRLMASHGLRWTYGNGDTQHFDATSGNGRVVMARGCTLPTYLACD